MTALSWYATIHDIVTGTLIASTSEVIDPEIHTTIDTSGTGRASFRPGIAFCDAVVAAWGGPSFSLDSKAYLFDLYQDGGTKPMTSLWVESGSIDFGGPNVGVTIEGKDISDGFDRSYIDKATYIDCAIEDVLGAAAGQIRVDPNSLILGGNTLPIWWEGFYAHTPVAASYVLSPRFKFDVMVSSSLVGNRVDTDINSDSIFRGTQNVLASASGIFTGNVDTFGANQHFAYDVPNQKVYCGHRTDASKVRLRGDISPFDANELIEAAIIDGDKNKMVPNLAAKFAQTEFVGGTSTHGMPGGGSFTGAVYVGRPASGLSTGAYDNLLVVGVTTGQNEMGGVFIWLGGYLRRFSQAMDVTNLTFDGTNNVLYASTNRGIFYRSLSGGGWGTATWQRLGNSDSLPQSLYGYTKVWVPSPGIVYAVAGGSTNGSGVNGVYRYDVSANMWSKVIYSSSIVDASGSDTELYYTTSNAPASITKTKYPSDGIITSVVGKGTEHILGLDFDANSGMVVIRTELGAQGLYNLKAGQATLVDPSGTIVDRFGPLMVAQYIEYQGSINGQAVDGVVVTDRGMYWRKAGSTTFKPTDGQNGIQNVNGDYVAIGSAQTVMGRTFVPIAILSGSALYLSQDGGIHFRDEMAQPLDALPIWYEIVRVATGSYPTGDMAAFASNAGVLQDTQGQGSIVVTTDHAIDLPFGWICARRWTANNTFTVRLLDLNSTAPYNAMRPAELVEIQADDTRSVLDGSNAVLSGAFRFLSQASRPMFTLNLTTTYATQESPLATLLNGDTVTVDYYVAYSNADGSHTSVLCDLANVDMIVIDKRVYTGSSAACLVDLILVNYAAFTLLDLQKIVAAVANGQAKDRRKAGIRIL